jgi:hypothetical protein
MLLYFKVISLDSRLRGNDEREREGARNDKRRHFRSQTTRLYNETHIMSESEKPKMTSKVKSIKKGKRAKILHGKAEKLKQGEKPPRLQEF